MNRIWNLANLVVLTQVNTNIDLDSMMGGIIDIIIKLAMYVGIALAAGGVFSWLLAYKDENSDNQARGIRLVVIGGALIGLRGLLALTGIIS